ncbi:hypothetical protein [Stenotrophomonas sp. 24(2023)]|nr:hypothetical protein [Stenotrophomonas sp. 24(2023)]WMJ71335.1 hypothetical protein Q9R17_09640 [Stenotrophomonas sp. 24(2023)]
MTSKKIQLETFDVVSHLRTAEEMAAYLDACRAFDPAGPAPGIP